MNTKALTGLGLAVLVGLVSGCSSTERRVDDVKISASATDNPSEQIATLEKEIADAKVNGVNLLSPAWYSSAEKSLERAKEARDDQDEMKEIFAETAQGRAQIAKARETAAVASSQLAEVVTARNEAFKAYQRAQAAKPAKFEELTAKLEANDEKLQEMALAVEDNDADEIANNKSDTVKAYQELTKNSVEMAGLGTARNVLATADSVDRFKAMSRLFTTQEAEVLTDASGKTIIRVKSLAFAPGSASLGAESLSVLGKVAQALKSYPTSAVVVEGHTDATGSAQLNQDLSQQRAEAVKSYLLSSNATGSAEVTAVGLGYKNPVASNKTAEGRKANRRIDVVLTAPSATTAE